MTGSVPGSGSGAAGPASSATAAGTPGTATLPATCLAAEAPAPAQPQPHPPNLPAGVDAELCIHPASGHGFFNHSYAGGEALLAKAQNPVPPKGEVEAAFSSTVAFFKKHLA
jgi:dienelactone hydrolase